MMRSLLPLLLLVSTSAYAAVPIKWSETLVKNLNTKTLRQAFCEKNVGYRAQASCDYFSKQKGALDQKVTSARIEGRSLFIAVGKRQIEIKSTDKPTQFEINRKIIDVRDYSDPESLTKALQAAIPKVAAGSFWINAAFAEEGELLGLLMTASSLMLSSSFDERWCGYAERFIRACNLNLSQASIKEEWDNIRKKVRNKEVLNSRDYRWIDADEKRLRIFAHQMRDVVKVLNKVETQNSLKRCPSYTIPPLANAQEDVLKCEKILAFKKMRAEAIPEMASTQQQLLTSKNLNAEGRAEADKQTEELADWMDYLTSSEARIPTPNEILSMPTQ